MEITNIHNLPEPLVAAVQNDPYHFDGDISTTAMIGPPRIRQLKLRYGKQIKEDVSDRIYALIGNNSHAILERVDCENVLREERFFATVQGWRIGGQIDLYEQGPEIHSDYKTTSVWAIIKGIKPEWEAQLNINSWLLEQNGHPVDRHQIVALLRDWSKHKAREKGYPSCQVKVVPAPIWKHPIDYIEARVLLHQAAEKLNDYDLPKCTADEMWEKPTTYAVKKAGRKTALRVLPAWEAAEKYIADKGLDDKHFIETRPGERIRCEGYCSVKDYCSQYLQLEEPPF